MLNKIREALSTIAAFRQDVILIRQGLLDLETRSEAHRVSLDDVRSRQGDLESQMKRTALEYAELHGKTYKLLKRMQMEDRTQTEPEPDIEPRDETTARVLARRHRGLPG